jgi:hypothetical protein
MWMFCILLKISRSGLYSLVLLDTWVFSFSPFKIFILLTLEDSSLSWGFLVFYSVLLPFLISFQLIEGLPPFFVPSLALNVCLK